MVKIRQLSNKQLVAQLEKYEKIYGQLLDERDKRVEDQGSEDGLLTPREIESRDEVMDEFNNEQGTSDSNTPEKTQAFHLKFDEDELNEMDAAVNKKSAGAIGDEESVRVTQLLKLSQSQLDELRENSSQAGNVKKVVKKKIQKKKQG